MTTKTTTCDICGYVFTGDESKERRSTHFAIGMKDHVPLKRKQYEDLCSDCVNEIVTSIEQAIRRLQLEAKHD